MYRDSTAAEHQVQFPVIAGDLALQTQRAISSAVYKQFRLRERARFAQAITVSLRFFSGQPGTIPSEGETLVADHRASHRWQEVVPDQSRLCTLSSSVGGPAATHPTSASLISMHHDRSGAASESSLVMKPDGRCSRALSPRLSRSSVQTVRSIRESTWRPSRHRPEFEPRCPEGFGLWSHRFAVASLHRGLSSVFTSSRRVVLSAGSPLRDSCASRDRRSGQGDQADGHSEAHHHEAEPADHRATRPW